MNIPKLIGNLNRFDIIAIASWYSKGQGTQRLKSRHNNTFRNHQCPNQTVFCYRQILSISCLAFLYSVPLTINQNKDFFFVD